MTALNAYESGDEAIRACTLDPEYAAELLLTESVRSIELRRLFRGSGRRSDQTMNDGRNSCHPLAITPVQVKISRPPEKNLDVLGLLAASPEPQKNARLLRDERTISNGFE